MERSLIIVAGVLGVLGVLAGTVGAHVLADRLELDMLARFETAARYHLYHTLALVGVLALLPRFSRRLCLVSAVLFVVGVVLFSGSLYAYALTNARGLVQITPVGGFAFMFGWLSLALAGIVKR